MREAKRGGGRRAERRGGGSIPGWMKAFVTTGHGGLDMLEYRDVPVPAPAAGEVLIEVGACGLNNTDIWTRQGSYGTERDPNAVTTTAREPGVFPLIQGCDVAGRIVDLGRGVPESRRGERVIVNLVEYDESDPTVVSGGIGSSRPGGYAEYVAVRSRNAYAVDSPLSDAELATFPCAYITAENMLDAAAVREGETVLVTGASGGVGSALLQLAAVRGARTVAVASRAKLDRVRTLEPFAAVARDEGDLVDTARAALGGDGVEVAADVGGGGAQFGAAARAAREGRSLRDLRGDCGAGGRAGSANPLSEAPQNDRREPRLGASLRNGARSYSRRPYQAAARRNLSLGRSETSAGRLPRQTVLWQSGGSAARSLTRSRA